MGLHEKTITDYPKRQSKWLWIVVGSLLTLVLVCFVMLDQLVSEMYTPALQQTQSQTAGILLDKDTSEKTVYSLEILSYDNIESEFVRNWADGKRSKGQMNGQTVYHTLYNDVYDKPIEMYLYMPHAREVMGDITLSNIKVSQRGKALVLNIDTDSDISHSKDGADMILRVFVTGAPEKAKAKTDRLIVNGKSFNCPGATFTPF